MAAGLAAAVTVGGEPEAISTERCDGDVLNSRNSHVRDPW